MPTKESGWITPDDIARWNRCVYEPNRDRVAEYRRVTGIPEPPMEARPVYGSGQCAWRKKGGRCGNPNCPARGAWCPAEDYPGLCRFASDGA